MIETFFLDYANSNLRENPSYLNYFVSEIIFRDEKIGGVEYVQEDVDEYQEIARAIISLVNEEKTPSPDDSDSFKCFSIGSVLTAGQEIPYENRKELVATVMERYKSFFGRSGFKHILSRMLGIYDIAYSSIYGHDYGICPTELLNDRVKLFGKKLFKGPKKLKCYECDQLHFTKMIDEIIEGKEYNQINWLESFIQISNDVVKFRREIEMHNVNSNDSNKNTPPSVTLKERRIAEIPLNFDKTYNPNIDDIYKADHFEVPRTPLINAFRLSLISAAFYSLTEFLLHNDKRKLKHCDECNEYFISDTLRNQRFCSSKCRLKFHNTRRIKSGEHREYKRKKRLKGAKESYYG